MRKTREETLRSRLADLAAQIEQLDKARAETKAMLDVLVGLPPEQRQVLEGYLEKVNPTPDPEVLAEAIKKAEMQPMPTWIQRLQYWKTPVDDHYPIEPPGVFNPLAHEQSK